MTEEMRDKRESDKRLKEELRGIREEMVKRRKKGVERRGSKDREEEEARMKTGKRGGRRARQR